MLSCGEIARATSGRIVAASPQAPDVQVTGISTDTRSLRPGECFVAIKGPRFDGHDCLIQARAAQAAAALVDAAWLKAQANVPTNLPCIAVEQTRPALGQLAAAWRRRFDLPLIAVAGSNGKTTVKEMLAAILRAAYGDAAVLATAGNFNNDIGLPLTLLRLRAEHRAAVVEIGMNHPGETAILAALAQPTVALINNAQREHQEFMRDVTAVAEEHADLLRALTHRGVAILPGDDVHLSLWQKAAADHPCLLFGMGKNCAIRATVTADAGCLNLAADTPAGMVRLSLTTLGLHHARNALAALAAALAVGVPLSACQKGLQGFSAVSGRMQKIPANFGGLLIDDSYNANPDSVRAAIDALAECGGERVLVLGDMGETGSQSAAFHEEICRYARQREIHTLFGMGTAMAAAVPAFGGRGQHFADAPTLVAALQPLLHRESVVLVKGSRFMKMETVVAALAAPAHQNLQAGGGNQHAT